VRRGTGAYTRLRLGKGGGLEIKKHKRVNDMLLGPLERPALQWLAGRMPSWATPDLMTGIGAFASVMVFAGYALTHVGAWGLWMVNVGLVLNWFGDALDGTLARYRKIERPKFGFFIDHTVDAVSMYLVIVGIGVSPYMRLDIAALLLVGYLLVSIHVYLRTCVDGVFKIAYSGIGPTEMRLIMILGNTAVFFWGNPRFRLPLVGETTAIDATGVVIAAVLTGVFLLASWRGTMRLYKPAK